MTVATDKLLLGGTLRPCTNTMGFFECSAEAAATTFWKWRDRTYSREGRILKMTPARANGLAEMIDLLLPLRTMDDRWLFIETQSGWCGFFKNNYRGVDPSPIKSLAYRCSCRGMRVTTTFADNQTGEMHACMWEVYKPTETYAEGTERGIWVTDDGGRWDFGEFGEPYPFERTDRYRLPHKRDRFTYEMLADYLQHFGIDAFNEEFYRPNGQCAGYLVHVDGPPMPGNDEHPMPSR